MLVDLAVEIAAYQMRHGRQFVFEAQTRMTTLRSLPGVFSGVATGCTFGLRCPDTNKLLSKSWEFVTSSPMVAYAVHRRPWASEDGGRPGLPPTVGPLWFEVFADNG